MTMCDWCKHRGVCIQPKWIVKAVKNDDLYCEGFKAIQMPRISMNRTTSAFVTKNKGVTRRHWQPVTIKRFRKDTKFLGVQRCYGGEALGIGQLTEDPFKQPTDEMITDDYIQEGFEYLDREYYEIQTALPHQTGIDFPLKYAFDSWMSRGDILSVVPFKIIEVFPGMKSKYTTDDEIVRCVKALVKAIG